jgi:hypothetical protein
MHSSAATRRLVLPAASRGRTLASRALAWAAERSFFAPPGMCFNDVYPSASWLTCHGGRLGTGLSQFVVTMIRRVVSSTATQTITVLP